MLKPLLRRPATQSLLAALLGRYLALALRTTRWSLHGREHVAPHLAGAPCIVAFWHERLPLMPALWQLAGRSGPRAHVLVSRHSDGRLIGELIRRFGLDIVHGSTGRGGEDRGGAAALRALSRVLGAGDHVAITPDGPRGPRRQAAAGVAQLAAVSGVPILPCAAQTSRRRILGTWDRMVLPLPFARGVIVCGPLIRVGKHDAEAALAAITAALNDAAAEADRLCP